MSSPDTTQDESEYGNPILDENDELEAEAEKLDEMADDTII